MVAGDTDTAGRMDAIVLSFSLQSCWGDWRDDSFFDDGVVVVVGDNGSGGEEGTCRVLVSKGHVKGVAPTGNHCILGSTGCVVFVFFVFFFFFSFFVASLSWLLLRDGGGSFVRLDTTRGGAADLFRVATVIVVVVVFMGTT